MMFDGVVDAIHMELGGLSEKYASGAKMTAQELDTVDKMAHALKCMATYEAMTDSYKRSRTPRYGYSSEPDYRRY